MDNTSAPEIAGFRSESATVNGTRLHFWIGGNPQGVPVLLWHGFLGTAYSWYKVLPLLARAGYSVLAPDMRGYGDSDKPAGTEGYDAKALAEEFRALVRQIEFGGGKKLFLAAHDMGAHPALLWAADHPDDLAGLVYMEVPTMLEEFLTKIIVYTPDAMKKGSMWWWILPLAPGVAERLIVGREREFLTWFYEGATADPGSITEASIQETLRSFRGNEGVLGALGLYRAAFTTIEQTTPLKTHKVKTPILALGGEKALGAKVAQMVEAIAHQVTEKLFPRVAISFPKSSLTSSRACFIPLRVGLRPDGRPHSPLCLYAGCTRRHQTFIKQNVGFRHVGKSASTELTKFNQEKRHVRVNATIPTPSAR